MARTRSAEYEDKQQSILEGAAHLFAKNGFAQTSIETLAKSLNASKAWIYHYYDSKEAVLYAMLKDHVERLLQTARGAVDPEASAEVRLRALVKAMLELYVDATNKHVVLMNELSNLTEEAQAELKSLQNELVDMFQTLIVELRPELAERRPLQRPLTMSLMGTMNWTYTWFKPDGPLTAGQFATLASDLFLGGLGQVRIDEETDP